MKLRQWFRPLVRLTLTSVFASSAALLSGTLMRAQVPTTLIGTTSATQTVTVPINSAGVISTVTVTTQGANGLDYNLVTGGACTATKVFLAAGTCTVKYTFEPTHPYTRFGAVTVSGVVGMVATNPVGVLGNVFLTGVGTGPQVSYPFGTATPHPALGSQTFSGPLGVAVDAAGDVFVADTKDNAVYEIVATNGNVTASSTVNQIGSGFSSPSAVAVDGAGNVYVADTGNSLIKQIVLLAGTYLPTTVTLASGTTFTTPKGVAVDGSGNVYVADTGSGAIDEIAAVNGVVSASSPVTMLGKASTFSTPVSVAVDVSGNVYVADSSMTSVTEIGAVGGVIPKSPTLTSLGSGFTSPSGIAVDGAGNVYVGDLGGKAVKEILIATGTINSLGTGYVSPASVAVDGGGSVFVADSGANAVEQMNAQTIPILTFASTAVGSTSSDSPMTASVTNNGNAVLLFPAQTSGSNPIVSTNFTLGSTSASACPQVAAGATTPGSLAAGATCTDSVSFSPVMVASSGTLTLYDNNLNSNPAATQIINLNGTATAGTPVVTVSSATVPVDTTSVTLSATVAFGGVVPTGAFTFTVGTASVTAKCTGTTSPLTCTANYNPSTLTVTGSPYTIQGTIAADSNYTTNAPSTGTLTITAASTTLTITSSALPSSTVDQPVTFTATLTSSASFSVPPTGTISFTAGGAALANCTNLAVSPSTHAASCAATALVAGLDVIAATYSGDTNFNGSTNTYNQKVNQNTPVTTVKSSLSSAVVNQAVTFTSTIMPANASSSGVTPTGSVTFTQGTGASATSVCAASVVTAATGGTATAACSAFFTSTFSNQNIYATYSGDTNFAGSAGSVAQTVTAASTTTTVTSVTNPSSVNQSVMLTGTVTPTNPVSTSYPGSATPQSGTLYFYDSLVSASTPICTSTLTAGVLTPSTCTYVFTSTGSHVISASFTSKDANFSNSTTANTVTQVVNTATVTLTVTAPGSLTVNQSATFTAAFSPVFTAGQAVPTGTVTYNDSLATTNPICTVTVTSTGSIPSCTGTLLVAGTHNITATYVATGSNFQGTTSAIAPLVVAQNTTTTTLTSPTASSTVDQQVTFSATLAQSTLTPAAVGNTVPTGSVTFKALSNGQTTNICTAPLSSAGTSASCTQPFQFVGTYTLTATYSGDTNFNGSTSTSRSQTVGQTGTSLAAVGSTVSTPASPEVNQLATYTVQLSLANGISDTNLTLPTRTVTFTDTTTSATCKATVDGTGQASCSFADTAAGTHSVSAVYSGDPNFSGSTQTFPNVVIAQDVVTISGNNIGITPTPATVNQTGVAFTVLLSPTYAGSVLPTGTVKFTDLTNGATCLSTLVGGMVPGCSYVFTSAGTHMIMATYSGDANFSGASNAPSSASVIINPAVPTITLVPSASPAVAGQLVTFTVTVTPPAAGVSPKGAINFANSSLSAATSCNVTPVYSGGVETAACNVQLSTAAAGAYTITANFAGDSNYTAVSTSITLIVQSFSISLTPPQLTVSEGNTNSSDPFLPTPNTVTFTETPQNGFADTTSASCTGVTGLSCTLSNVTVTNGVTTASLIVTAASSVPAGIYNLTVTAGDSAAGRGNLVQTATAQVTVLNEAYPNGGTTPYSVPTSGTVTVAFSTPSAALASGTLTCDTNVATLINSTSTVKQYTLATGKTLGNIGLVCSAISGSGTGYNVTITAGSGTASLQRFHIGTNSDRIALAVLGLPCLLLFAFPRRRRAGKAVWSGLTLCLLALATLNVSGCSTGGFVGEAATLNATPGNYLIAIVNASGTVVAEVPLVVAGNL